MTAEELFRAGRLSDAIGAQTALVKAHPLDTDARFFLFVLLCFSGELERAETQLETVVQQDQDLQTGALIYRSMLGSELERRRVYREGAKPVLPPDAPRSLALRQSALAHLASGDAAAAARALEEAEDEGVSLVGKLNDEGYDGLRDYDDVLGQVLELYTGGRYLWLPFEQVRKLSQPPPRTHVDLLWAPVEIEDGSGRELKGFVPVLYEGSHGHPDERVRVGSSTEWLAAAGEAFRGAGQRILYTVSGDADRQTPLLEVRTLENALAGD